MRLTNRARLAVALVVGLPTMLAAAPGSAEDVTLTASTGTGVMYGMAREFVYDSYNNQAYTLSELDWDLKALLITKAELSVQTIRGFSASLGVQVGVPSRTGSISDSDWKNIPVGDPTTKTNYSQSDCFTERAILLDARAGWEIPLAGWVTLEPFLTFGFMDFKWTARDGYLQYASNYSSSTLPPYFDYTTGTPFPMSGTGIIYEQTYFIPAVGIEARFHFGNFGGSFSFAASPFVFCNDVDNHEFGGNDFYDTMSNGVLLEPKISVVWQRGRSHLSLDVSYRHIAGLVGNTTTVHNGIGKPPGQVADVRANAAGASYDVMGASLSYSWAL